MVPHIRALRAIALTAHLHARADERAMGAAADWGCKFPCEWDEFCLAEIYSYLPGDLEAWLRTTDIATEPNLTPLFGIAKALGISEYIGITAEGPSPLIPRRFRDWRQNETMRVMLDTMLIAGIGIPQIVSDLKRVYQFAVDEIELTAYAELFVDVTHLQGESWFAYEACVGAKEATFKRQLIGQPHDYVRWRLGIPVTLETEKVLDRLISDAYYTERLIKQGAGPGGMGLGKDELVRIKLERDTLFKALNARTKMKELDSAANASESEGMKMLASVVMKFVPVAPVTVEELGTLDQLPSVE